MNIQFPENISTEEYTALFAALEYDKRSTLPGIRAAIEQVKENFKGTKEYSQEVQNALESVFGTLEYSLADKAAFVREIAQDHRICISPVLYPYFSNVVQEFAPILCNARGYTL